MGRLPTIDMENLDVVLKDVMGVDREVKLVGGQALEDKFVESSTRRANSSSNFACSSNKLLSTPTCRTPGRKPPAESVTPTRQSCSNSRSFRPNFSIVCFSSALCPSS